LLSVSRLCAGGGDDGQLNLRAPLNPLTLTDDRPLLCLRSGGRGPSIALSRDDRSLLTLPCPLAIRPQLERTTPPPTRTRPARPPRPTRRYAIFLCSSRDTSDSRCSLSSLQNTAAKRKASDDDEGAAGTSKRTKVRIRRAKLVRPCAVTDPLLGPLTDGQCCSDERRGGCRGGQERQRDRGDRPDFRGRGGCVHRMTTASRGATSADPAFLFHCPPSVRKLEKGLYKGSRP
jgi:hypothetical protein